MCVNKANERAFNRGVCVCVCMAKLTGGQARCDTMIHL